MSIEIIAIGNEVLGGFCVNSNAAFLSALFIRHGLEVSRHVVLSDDVEEVNGYLSSALKRGVMCVTTGGLGPTLDDFGREIASRLFHRELLLRPALLEKLEAVWGKGNSCLPDQATLPEGAEELPNPVGTASGLLLIDENLYPNGLLAMLPGVPPEMRLMAEEQLLPRLVTRINPQSRQFVKMLSFFGVRESEMDPYLRDSQGKEPRLDIGIYPGQGMLTVHLKAKVRDEKEAEILWAPLVKELLMHFGENFIDSSHGRIEEALHTVCSSSGITVATAESCTGGAIAARIVSHPGASVYFRGSLIAYVNELKESLLGVPQKDITQYGAVSTEVTNAMALGCADKMGASCAIAVSGILGPTGGTEEKPVGTVACSIVIAGHVVHAKLLHFKGSREMICEKVVQYTLNTTYSLLLKRSLR